MTQERIMTNIKYFQSTEELDDKSDILVIGSSCTTATSNQG